MKNFFEKFKDIGKAEQKNLDVVMTKEPVRVLIVSHYDWINRHIEYSLEKIGFPAGLVSFVYNQNPTSGKYDLVYGMHHHTSIPSFDEIGKFRNLGDFLIYSDCCHGKQGMSCGADTWVCDDYVADYTAWAVKDISEDVDDYLKLGRDFMGVVKLAIKNNDLARAKKFAEICSFEIDDVEEDTFNLYGPRGVGQFELAEILFKSGIKELVIGHYQRLSHQIDKLVKNAIKYGESNQDKADKNWAVFGHLNLFEKLNPQLGITEKEFDIDQLKRNYRLLK